MNTRREFIETLIASAVAVGCTLPRGLELTYNSAGDQTYAAIYTVDLSQFGNRVPTLQAEIV